MTIRTTIRTIRQTFVGPQMPVLLTDSDILSDILNFSNFAKPQKICMNAHHNGMNDQILIVWNEDLASIRVNKHNASSMVLFPDDNSLYDPPLDVLFELEHIFAALLTSGYLHGDNIETVWRVQLLLRTPRLTYFIETLGGSFSAVSTLTFEENIHVAPFVKIYKMRTLFHCSKLNVVAKLCTALNSNLQNCASLCRRSMNFPDFEKCC